MRKFMSDASELIVVLLATVSLVTPAAATPVKPVTTGWSQEERGILATLLLRALGPVPRDPSNAFERNPAAIALGKRLFNDQRFSRNQQVSCASCHDQNKQFQDGLPVSKGVGTGSRRAMPIAGVGHNPWLFWDGRKDSVWSQALGPLEDAVEHGGTRSRYAHLLQTHYRAEYESVFQPMPDLSMVPQDAGPAGTPDEQAAWKALDPKHRFEVSRVFANMGKAIAAYEKSLMHGESRFDRYVDAILRGAERGKSELTGEEQNGLRLFIGKGQCVTCHNGPLLTDRQFHNTAVPQRDLSTPDHGRLTAIAKVKADEFNCLGPFSDALPEQCTELRFIVKEDKSLDAAFKTPSLRGVALRPPYMHAGQLNTLTEVLAHYVSAPKAQVGHTELAHGEPGHTERKPIQLSAREIQDVIAFLGTLSGPITESLPR
jgi:cytochrome c peroxidase